MVFQLLNCVIFDTSTCNSNLTLSHFWNPSQAMNMQISLSPSVMLYHRSHFKFPPVPLFQFNFPFLIAVLLCHRNLVQLFLFLFITGKRVLLCTMRNSVNNEMLRPESNIRDYDVLHLVSLVLKVFLCTYESVWYFWEVNDLLCCLFWEDMIMHLWI